MNAICIGDDFVFSLDCLTFSLAWCIHCWCNSVTILWSEQIFSLLQTWTPFLSFEHWTNREVRNCSIQVASFLINIVLLGPICSAYPTFLPPQRETMCLYFLHLTLNWPQTKCQVKINAGSGPQDSNYYFIPRLAVIWSNSVYLRCDIYSSSTSQNWLRWQLKKLGTNNSSLYWLLNSSGLGLNVN